MRDRLIKEKLGISLSNFMPGGGTNINANNASNNAYGEHSFDLLTM